MKKITFYWLILLALASCDSPVNTADFVKIQNSTFIRHGQPYYFVGANYWYGDNIGTPEGGDRARLARELDKLKELGVNNLRIQIASEGGDEVKFGVRPSLQSKQGVFNENSFVGIDYVLAELAKRDMVAVLVLNNYWSWTGGMAKYLEWNGVGEIPYPSSEEPNSWSKYMSFTDGFYKDSLSRVAFLNTVSTIVKRENSISKVAYINDPTIMAWELANEPRGGASPEERKLLIDWIGETAEFIKKIDPNHLVTTGSEGKVGHQQHIEDFEAAHAWPAIDYLCIHLWPQNWSWFDPSAADSTYDNSVVEMKAYIQEHLDVAVRLNKPVVVEEFGLARDSSSFEIDAPATFRARFFNDLLDFVYLQASTNKPVAGTNFWGWSGEGRPRVAGELWQAGDQLIGDPPHEAQGWYGIFDTDTDMLDIVAKQATRMNTLK